MTTPGGSETFYGSIAVFRGFGRLMDPALYSPLPDDWSIGVADIVDSTKAIAQARYKAVNVAGASQAAEQSRALAATVLSASGELSQHASALFKSVDSFLAGLRQAA